MKGLAGRSAIVTGAGQGIGRAIAARLHEEGARVLAVDKSAAGLSALPQDVRIVRLEADVTAVDSPARIVAACLSAFGSLDILVNNAGAGNAPPVHETTDEFLDFQLNLNLRSVFRLSRDALAALQNSKGAIVNISSSVAVMGYRRSGAYSAAKAGIIGLTRNMAADYGPDGVRVNAVAPGVVATPLTNDRLHLPRFRANVVETMPLGQVVQSDDIAAAVAFLCSSDARMITGQILAVDGGQTSSVFISDAMVANWEAAHQIS